VRLRIRPSIPPLVFGADEVLPVNYDASPVGAFPISLYRHQRLLRAFGSLPTGVRLPPAFAPPRAQSVPVHGPGAPFLSDFSVAFWNVQAFFHSDDGKHEARVAYVCRLLAQYSAVGLAEVHGTDGEAKAWKPPIGCKAYWSCGPSASSAGVGLIVRQTFLDLFAAVAWDMVWPGRAARLRLQGNAGNIDLWVLYFHTGSQVSDADRMHVLPYASEQCHTFEGLREHMRNRIGRAMADSRTTLSFVAGDFNWAAQDDDRRSAGSLEHSGHRDHAEERHWDSTVLARREMYEFHQAEYTHRSASARSRLDRFYGNLAVTDQLDRHISVSALEWKRGLSHHRAIGFSKQTPVRDNSSGVSITAIHHKDFPRRVRLEFQSLVQQEDKDKVGFSGAEKNLRLIRINLPTSRHLPGLSCSSKPWSRLVRTFLGILWAMKLFLLWAEKSASVCNVCGLLRGVRCRRSQSAYTCTLV